MLKILSMFLAVISLCLVTGCQVNVQVGDRPIRLAAVYVPGGLRGLPYKGKIVKEYPYNDKVHDTLIKARETLGIAYENILTESTDEYESTLRDLAQGGKYDVIIVNGFQATKALLKVAKEFPNQKFMGVESGTDQEGTPHNLPNLAAYTANYYQPMYAAGALAAMMTKTGTIGCVWSMDEKKYGSYVRAYTDGAKSINPNIKVVAAYTGSYQELPAKGKAKAEEVIAQGADIVMNHTQAEHTGVIEAILRHGKDGVTMIGFDHESALAPASALFDLNRHQSDNFYQALKDLKEGKFEAGTIYQGLVEGHYTLDFTSPPHPRITTEVRRKVDEIVHKFRTGELKKPWTAEIPDLK